MYMSGRTRKNCALSPSAPSCSTRPFDLRNAPSMRARTQAGFRRMLSVWLSCSVYSASVKLIPTRLCFLRACHAPQPICAPATLPLPCKLAGLSSVAEPCHNRCNPAAFLISVLTQRRNLAVAMHAGGSIQDSIGGTFNPGGRTAGMYSCLVACMCGLRKLPRFILLAFLHVGTVAFPYASTADHLFLPGWCTFPPWCLPAV